MPTRTVIGFDLGGTKSAIALYDADSWKLLQKEKIPTRASEGFETVFSDTVDLIQKLRRDDTVAVGVGVPGLIHQPEGLLINTPNIPGGRNLPLKKMYEEKLGLPVAIENDARGFTLAEALQGAGKGHKVVIGITMGTGVGGGIVIDGKVFHGSDGFAGEIGHMLLQPGQPPYETDDKRGEVEQFISGTAMGNRCPEAKDPNDYLNGAVCSFLHPQIFREAAWMVVSLTYLLNPSIVVFGGSAGASLMSHLTEVEEEVHKWMLPGTPQPRLVKAELEDPGTLGASLSAMNIS